jgi:hypothetical protein
MILHVVVRVLCGSDAEEVRSDAESEPEPALDDALPCPPARQLAPRRPGPSLVDQSPGARYAKASGVTLPGHADLLGRIGCERGA